MKINAKTFLATFCCVLISSLITSLISISEVVADDDKPGIIKKKYVHTCPAGTERVGEGPPDTRVMFCRQPLHNTSRLEGNYATFFQNGNKKIHGEYSQGKKHGKWVQYYRTGEVREVKKYADGKPFEEKTFKKDGAKIKSKKNDEQSVEKNNGNNGKVYSELRQMRRKGNTKGRSPVNMGWPGN